MKNYVPFEDYPDGGKAEVETDTITVESDTTGEEKRREEEKGEKENNKNKEGESEGSKDVKWKENYVPHNEVDENEG